MKKISLLFTLAFLAFSGSLFGQNAQPVSDQVTLKVQLNAIQTLVVNNTQNNITLEYITKDDYQNGVKSENEDHLTVYSTGGFQLHAHSDNSEFNKLNVHLIAKDGKTNGLPGTDADIILANQKQNLIYETKTGKLDSTVNVTYAGEGANKYFNLLGTELNKTFTTTVTYTLTPQ